MAEKRLTIPSPIGPLTLVQEADALSALRFGDEHGEDRSPLLLRAVEALELYFRGDRPDFDSLPLHPRGTPFQLTVWQAMRLISYGEVCSYGALAEKIGSPQAARAVGMAAHRNPLPLFLPCHRVVGHSGELVGYAGGLEKKRFLLALEQGGKLPL